MIDLISSRHGFYGFVHRFGCTVFTGLFLLTALGLSCLHAADIADAPLEAIPPVPPANIMFIVDNAGSTDCEFLTCAPQGLFMERKYLFPDSSYTASSDVQFKQQGVLDQDQRRYWQSQWCGYNKIYYDPSIAYEPWLETAAFSFEAADPNLPFSDPIRKRRKVRLFDQFFTVASGMETLVVSNAHYFIVDDQNKNGRRDDSESIYLVTWVDSDKDAKLDTSGFSGADERRYYQFVDNGNNLVEDNELISITDERLKERIRRFCRYSSGSPKSGSVIKSDKEDLLNFANWFSYHRRRHYAIKSAVTRCIAGLKQANVGIYAVNSGPRLQPRAVDAPMIPSDCANEMVIGASRAKEALMNAVYQMEIRGDATLKSALDQIGRFFHVQLLSDMGPSPYFSQQDGGACQRAVAVIATDGLWNDAFSGIGNVDGGKGRPFADRWHDTLADIAMHYYETDLAPELLDLVPAGICDTASHQHLSVFCMSPALGGMINVADIDDDGVLDVPGYREDPCLECASTPLPPWPEPIGGQVTTHDDLLHTAINGRGMLFHLQDAPDLLADAVSSYVTQSDLTVCSSTVAAESGVLSDNHVVFQAFFDTSDWTGDLVACSVDFQSGDDGELKKKYIWRASSKMKPTGAATDARCILSFGGPFRRPAGIPFRFHNLSGKQKAALGSDLIKGSPSDLRAAKILDFIRGVEFADFRDRSSLLGDIVHSVPVVIDDTVFVGANDGMVHAFSIENGYERFAYVPNHVFGDLERLCKRTYRTGHRFYVDGPLSIGEVLVGRYKRNSYLTGGLGKGGKGYFCLLVRSRERISAGDAPGDYQNTYHVDAVGHGASETDASHMVQWEYPWPDVKADGMDNDGDGETDEADEIDPDIGYSFSVAYTVNANAPDSTYRPVVIFGNGYDSDRGRAVLYVLDAQTGKLIRKLDTGAGGGNGLSTPALIDVNLDRCVDYAYAGDLKGNLWKFDLTSENPGHWSVAYGEDQNRDGIIDTCDGDHPQPLFQTGGQPITGRPDIMAMKNACLSQASGFMVFFGTGKYMGASDRYDCRQQRIYGLWDYGDDSDDSENLGRLVNPDNGMLSSGLRLFRRRVVDEFSTDGTLYREISNDKFDFKLVEDTADGDGVAANNRSASQHDDPIAFAGWYLDLPDADSGRSSRGERVTGPAIVRGGTVIIASYVPETRPCSNAVGTSWLYFLNGCTGGMPRNEAGKTMKTIGFSGRLKDPMLVFKNPDNLENDYLVVGDEKALIRNMAFSGEKWGRIYWRENLK